MKSIKNVFLFLFCVINFILCSSNEVDECSFNDSEIRTLNIIYKGVKYNVQCEFFFKNDSVTFLDNDFNNIYLNEISKIQNLAVFPFHDEEGIEWLEYFDNEQQLLKERNMQILDAETTQKIAPVTKAGEAGRAILWDDNGYHDSSVTINLPYDLFFSCPHLKPPYGFNDKCSAIKVWNYIPDNYQAWFNGNLYSGHELRTVLISYEDDNYRGGVLYCVASNSGVHADTNLKDIPFKGSKTWNDRITSVKFVIAYRDTYQSHP